MADCRKSYLRYKELCAVADATLENGSHRDVDPSLPREDEEQLLQTLFRQFQRCRSGREHHRDRCYPRDQGRQTRIDMLQHPHP
jgi:hypothetical protein